jgi:hypothetical protein
MDSAQKIVKGIVAAGGAVVEEAAKAAGVGPKSGTPPASPGGEGK